MEPPANEPEPRSKENAQLALSDGINPLPGLLKWLGDHRDGFLVAGAALYGLGYLVWSYTAWKTGRGLLPALELQYIVAGFVPAIIIAVAWTAISLFYRIRDRLLAFTVKHRRWGIAIGGAVVLGFVLTVVVDTATGYQRWTAPLVLVFFYLMALLAKPNFRLGSPARGRMLGQVFGLAIGLYRYLIPVTLAYYGVLFYLDLYPKLPQELGGPEPRSAYVDMIVKEVSKDTLDVLVPPYAPPAVATTDAPQVVRSRRLQVFFSSNDYLLVKPAPDEHGQDLPQTGETPLYELKKEVIRAVTWTK